MIENNQTGLGRNEAELIQMTPNKERGRVGVPILLWIAGVPFTLVFFIWLFFFRG